MDQEKSSPAAVQESPYHSTLIPGIDLDRVADPAYCVGSSVLGPGLGYKDMRERNGSVARPQRRGRWWQGRFELVNCPKGALGISS